MAEEKILRVPVEQVELVAGMKIGLLTADQHLMYAVLRELRMLREDMRRETPDPISFFGEKKKKGK